MTNLNGESLASEVDVAGSRPSPITIGGTLYPENLLGEDFSHVHRSDREYNKRCGNAFSRAGGDRTHDRGIMGWLLSVGLVRWSRIHPDIKEILSGGVGLVCGMIRGIFSIGVLACGFLSEGRLAHSTGELLSGTCRPRFVALPSAFRICRKSSLLPATYGFH